MTMKKMLLLAILACALCVAPYSALGQTTAKSKGKSKSKSKGAGSAIAAPSFDTLATPAAPGTNNAGSGTEVKATAAGGGKSDAKSDAKGGEAKADPAAGGMPEMSFDFSLMRADSMEIDPDGLTVLTNRVRVESKDINISCDQLKVDNKTKKMTSVGSPVKMDRPGLVAQCRNLSYNLDTKNMVLEDNAQIIQDQAGGKKTQIKADVIKIDQPPNGGKQKMSLIMRNGTPPEIRSLGGETPAATTKKTGGATAVSENNLDVLKLPSAP